MYRVDYDSSDDELEMGWSSSFEKHKRKHNVNSQPVDPLDVERNVVNACISGDLSVVKQYYSGESPVFKPDRELVSKLTALMQAASYSQDHILKYLLEIGANPNYKCDGITALMCACVSSSTQTFATLECIKCLIKEKALINVGDRFGVTPLMKAIMCNKLDVVKLLLSNDANVEMRNNVGRTAIFYAVEYKLPEMVKLLLRGNARLDNIDRRGYTIKMLAKNEDCVEILNMLKELLPDDDDEEEFVTPISDGIHWSDMLPNTSVSRNRPAFSFEIRGLLHGMDCERLEPLINEANMDLATFLTLDDEALKTLGVNLPYERLKVLSGLKLFHTYGWKIASVLGLTLKGRYFEALNILDILSCHMKNITVLQCSIDYDENRSKEFNLPKSSKTEKAEQKVNLIKEIDQTLKELNILKTHILKINKNNLPPADLIVPNNPPSKKSFKKTKMVFCSVSVLMLTVLIGFKYKATPNISLIIPEKIANFLLKK